MSRYNRGFGIAIVIVFTIFVVAMISGCISFGGGPQVDMQERGQQICKDANGEWIDHRCVYPAW